MCGNADMSMQGGRDSQALVFRGPVWVQSLYWLVVVFGAAVAVVAPVLMIQGQPGWTAGFYVMPVGVFMVVMGWFGLRMRVRVSPAGVDLRQFRRTQIPAADIRALVSRHVPGAVDVPRSAVAVIKMDWSEVRLDPTLAVGLNPDKVEARIYARIKAMYAALQLEPQTQAN